MSLYESRRIHGDIVGITKENMGMKHETYYQLVTWGYYGDKIGEHDDPYPLVTQEFAQLLECSISRGHRQFRHGLNGDINNHD